MDENGQPLDYVDLHSDCEEGELTEDDLPDIQPASSKS